VCGRARVRVYAHGSIVVLINIINIINRAIKDKGKVCLTVVIGRASIVHKGRSMSREVIITELERTKPDFVRKMRNRVRAKDGGTYAMTDALRRNAIFERLCRVAHTDPAR
jgi:hypothetical protein